MVHLMTSRLSAPSRRRRSHALIRSVATVSVVTLGVAAAMLPNPKRTLGPATLVTGQGQGPGYQQTFGTLNLSDRFSYRSSSSPALATPVSLPPHVNTYYGYDAADYANTYALHYNAYYRSYNDDCTNFVSQALFAGGMPMQGEYGEGYLSWWYSISQGPSNSWINVGLLKTYLTDDNPGGTQEAEWGPAQDRTPYTPNSIVEGDLIFYNWSGGIGMDHVSMQVWIGTDPNSGMYGDLVDQHTTNRNDAFWSLYPYNPQRATTDYYLEHIWSSN